MSRKLLFSIASYDHLAPDFLAAAEDDPKPQAFDKGHVERKLFPDGERYLRIATDPWARDVVLLAGTPTDADCVELYDLGYAISRAGARSLSIVIPYFGYATMERATRPGEVVTAKTRARLISAIPPCEAGSRVFLFDLHTDGIEFYFGDGHVTHHIYGASLITAAARDIAGTDFVLGATDAGRAKWVQSLARDLGVEPAFVYKHRDPVTGSVAMTGINADVRGKPVVIYDDMIRTGSSLLQAGRAYRDAGASEVHAIASHLVLPGDSLDKILGAGVFTSLAGTNSHPGAMKLKERGGRVVSVAPLLVRSLLRSF